MKHRLIETLVDLEALASAWHELPAARNDPLVSHDWFCAAASTLHRDQRLRVATVWSGQKLMAAAPLVETRHGVVGRLEFIGMTALYEPCHVLFRDEDAFDSLVAYLVELRRPMCLQRIPTGAGLAAALRSKGSGRLVSVPGASCRRVDLLGSWDEYLAKRSRECRAGFPRKLKQLATHGNVTFESLAPAPELVPVLLDEFLRVESAGWKSRAAGALAARPQMEAFFRELSRRFAARGQVRMCFLRCNGHAVAAQIGLQYGGRIWELKVGYDERWKAVSPGRLLLWQMLRDAFARGLDAYEFLGAGDGQQAAWSTSEQCRETLVYYPYSIEGMAAAATDLGSAATRRAASVLRRCRH